MEQNPTSTARQRPAAAGIAIGATIGSFAAASALSSDDAAADSSDPVAAATSADDTAVTTAGTAGDTGPDGVGMGPEEPLTGDLADRVTAVAEAAVPGGTVERVETDAHGAACEAHVLDADGNPVTVTFDEDLAVVETITGEPLGHGHGGPGRRGDHDDAAATDTRTDTRTAS